MKLAGIVLTIPEHPSNTDSADVIGLVEPSPITKTSSANAPRIPLQLQNKKSMLLRFIQSLNNLEGNVNLILLQSANAYFADCSEDTPSKKSAGNSL